MHKTVANQNAEALLDLEITFHPEALRKAFLGRGGLLWRFLRLAFGSAVLLLAVGAELAWPRFYSGLPIHPLWLVIAYLGCNSSLFLSMLAAWSAGFLICAGNGTVSITYIIAFMLATGLLRILRIMPCWKNRGGWFRAVIAGAATTALIALYEALFLSFGLTWSAWGARLARELLLGTALAAFAAAPALFFCWDCVTSLATGKPLFIPRPIKPLLPESLPQYPT